jgi:hypothetical protein
MESNTVPIQAPGGVPVMPLLSPNQSLGGTQDGAGAGDHDTPYTFGRRPRGSVPFPFSTRQYVHLLVLRSRIDADLFGRDDRSS